MITKNYNYIKYYHLKLNELKIPFKEKLIKTSFGKTNIIICGDSNKPPFFLVHGLNSAAPFAIESVQFLLKEHHIFAIDLLGEPNISDLVKISKKDDSYGKWLLEITNYFNIKNITLCGISFGAFPILKSLLIDNKNIKQVFLISPAGIIHGNILASITKFLIPMKLFQLTKKNHFLKKCLNSIYNDFDSITFAYLKEVFLHFKMDFSPTPNFKTEDLATIKTPISIISSKKDFFVPGEKLKKKSEKGFNNLKNFIVLENAKHVPSLMVLEDAFTKLSETKKSDEN
ncbi:alpha/beta hydrolase [Polaribacter cellanae]|uniref:Alpha/beta hydrolase n=1 Tax=Polaribacter cellanae TaxID=2818493 RepID=A0A975CSV4_9FLAO|nr:alpha/beta hydrolase [Polaribacter cellanae]QTE24339.1 alpha/beta hydrolase [Polaribacter cellanae]